MTLVELLIAALIVSFMLVGVLATDYAVRSMNAKVTDDVTLGMQLRTVAEYIRRDAMSATGESGNPGVTYTGSRICFREDLALTPTAYGDDTWVCYTLLGNNLRKCSGAVEADCAGTDTFVGRLITNAFTVNPPTFSNGHFYVKLQTRLNPAAAMNANTNPQAEAEVSVYPVGHSNN